MYASPIQHPSSITNPTPTLQSNTTASVASIISAGTSSPIQTSLMFRPVSSPFSISNRSIVYDKNKRTSYPTDIRSQQTSQPSQISYGTVMGGNQITTPSTVVMGGTGAIKQQ